MEPFNETLPALPLEFINAETIATDLAAWQSYPPDPDFTLILESELINA
jgi:hypothetical protein